MSHAKVDRSARERMITSIDDYLSESITAFEFDDQLFEISGDSKDPTVTLASSLLWLCYDDITDHKVVLSKEGWDFIQRLRLILSSDCTISRRRDRIWCAPQIFALLGLLTLAITASVVGWGMHLFLLSIPLGVVSILLSRWRRRYLPPLSQRLESIYPFADWAQLRSIRSRVPGYQKQIFPARIATRTIRTPSAETVAKLQTTISWLVFSPAVLFFQVFPVSDTRNLVIEAK